jgi:hypothetical protein
MEFINPESEKFVEKGWDEENKCITILFTLTKKRKVNTINLLVRL